MTRKRFGKVVNYNLAILALVCAGTSLPLKASEIATGTISFNQINGTTFHYSLSLTDAGTTSIGTFWFAWVPGEDFMPTSPANILSPVS
jgi:hypothetical protein